jgi:hypothetical protein
MISLQKPIIIYLLNFIIMYILLFKLTILIYKKNYHVDNFTIYVCGIWIKYIL